MREMDRGHDMAKELINMTAEEGREIIREIMTAYDTARAAWLSRFGNAEGFDDWFRKETLGNG